MNPAFYCSFQGLQSMASYNQVPAKLSDKLNNNGEELMHVSSSVNSYAVAASNSLDNQVAPTTHRLPLRIHVEHAIRDYFATLDEETPTDLYALILKEIELPLLTVVLEQTRGNQSKCAQILGFNRGTLRKKMKAYDLL